MAENRTRQLAAFAAELAYEDLPPGVVEIAKRLILDTLGTAWAATTLGAGCAEVVAVMGALGGKPESTIVGSGARVSAPNAAFANGALAHALNYDAIGDETGHTGVVCLTPALAAAEACAPVSGRRLIAAAVAASEITARLSLANVRAGNHLSKRVLAGQFFGYLGAAAGAGSILGLNAAKMHSAFGLALMQVAGSRQVVIGGDPPAKAIYGAYPNGAGVLAALLAQAGLDAEVDAVEGEAGVFGLATGGTYDAPSLTDGLGERFAFVNAQFKPWAVSGHVAPFIEGALDLAVRHDLHPAGIAAVELIGPVRARDWFEPIAERRRPANAASAANSTMFAAAKALAHRKVVLADFSAAGLRDEIALALADRVTYRLEDPFEGGSVTVRTTDGRSVTATVARPLGDPTRPMSRAALEDKFRDCCSYAPALAAADVTAMIDFIANLEERDDVSGLLRR